MSLPVSANKRGSSYFGSVAELTIEDGQQNYILGFIDEVTKFDAPKFLKKRYPQIVDFYFVSSFFTCVFCPPAFNYNLTSSFQNYFNFILKFRKKASYLY